MTFSAAILASWSTHNSESLLWSHISEGRRGRWWQIKTFISVGDALMSLVDQLWIYGDGLAARHWSPPGLTDLIWKHLHVFRSPWRPLCVFFSRDKCVLEITTLHFSRPWLICHCSCRWLLRGLTDYDLATVMNCSLSGIPKSPGKIYEKGTFFFFRILKSLISHRALTADIEISKDQLS